MRAKKKSKLKIKTEDGKKTGSIDRIRGDERVKTKYGAVPKKEMTHQRNVSMEL